MAISRPNPGSEETSTRWALLAARIRTGDKDALSELYDASSGQVFGLVSRIVGDRAVAEEIALDVYLQVWRGSSVHDPERGSATAWLLLLARSRAIDYLRSKAGHARGREQALPEEYRQVADRSPDPEVAAQAGSRRSIIEGALGRLDADKRRAIELAFFGGLSHSEISERLGLPIGTVKTRIRTGMQQLRTVLEPLGGAL